MAGKDSATASIGIDFGTSTTLIATREGALSTPLPIGEGANPWVPSVVGLDGGEIVAGERAERLPAHRRVRSAKRYLTDGRQKLTTSDGAITTEDAVRAILSEAIGRARNLGVHFDGTSNVQFGCPAMWQAPERELLVQIARECGIGATVADVIDEPIAAGVAWIQDRSRAAGIPDCKVLVFDAGGGTLDVALLQVRQREGGPEVTVLAAEGVNESGDDLDRSIAELLRQKYEEELGRLSPPAVVDSLLLDRARQLKEALSDVPQERLALGAAYDVVVELNQAELESAFARQSRGRALRLVESTLRSGKLREEQTLGTSAIRRLPSDALASGIDHVVLVGGLSRVPMLERQLRERFPAATIHVLARPQEAIVRGLVFSEEIERLNLHRPAFHFDVLYLDKSGVAVGDPVRVYSAFSPLYTPADLCRQQSDIGHRASVPKVPNRAQFVELRCQSVDGRAIDLNISGLRTQGVRVPASVGSPVTFKLYTNGTIVFGPHGARSLRVKSWPTLRGSHHNWLLTLDDAETPPHEISPTAVYGRSTRG